MSINLCFIFGAVKIVSVKHESKNWTAFYCTAGILVINLNKNLNGRSCTRNTMYAENEPHCLCCANSCLLTCKVICKDLNIL